MRHLKTIIKAVISIVLFSYLVYTSDQARIVEILGNIYKLNGILYLSLAVIAGLLSIFLMTIRWQIILKQYDQHFSLKTLFEFYLIGLFFNNFLPTSIGGDIIRIYKVVGDNEDRTAGFASVILERVLGIASTLFLAITSLYYVSHYFEDDRILYTSVILFCMIVGFFILVTRKKPFEFLLSLFDKFTLLKIGEKITKLIEAFYFLKEKRKVFIWVFVLSFFSQALIVLMNYAIVLAMDIEVDLMYLFLVVPVTFMLTMLPSINGVGIRDGGYVFMLAKVGVSRAAAISLSFMNVLIPMVISLWGAVLFFTQRKKITMSEVEAIEKNF